MNECEWNFQKMSHGFSVWPNTLWGHCFFKINNEKTFLDVQNILAVLDVCVFSGTRPIWRSNPLRCWGSVLVWFHTPITTSPPETPTSVLWASRLWVRPLISKSACGISKHPGGPVAFTNAHTLPFIHSHWYSKPLTHTSHFVRTVCGHQTWPAWVDVLLCVCRPFPATVSECH